MTEIQNPKQGSVGNDETVMLNEVKHLGSGRELGLFSCPSQILR